MLTGIKTMESRSRAFKNSLLAVVDGQLDKMDLTSYDVIIFPMFEHHHFYLVCFDMNCPAIEVIDNMHKENCWVSLKDNPKFLSKGTPCKVRHIFSAYLKEVKHPKALSIPHVAPRRRVIDWGTRENFTDCGIFAMRHMEAYFGSSKPLNCGFNNKESEQQEQIKNLRMKYAAKILLSDANLLKRKVIEDARKVADKKKVA
ncbi:putative Ulp1 protease family catalytic domain, papain-like cysteine peptidase superfamily [Helianthus annuus]|nr:putative Ulp1 protease family catalytic domain, papain-like cysteine peptidase superfamily [Helianthus annuus]KAJ0720039.1 putative Ulp1 protease family catalytic domain, papain-like cysteine peptidase superfamily [Helianthus annuus]KAJ0899000.1 putative Ulp1 protease family catalytic domain, papain-like cysteine peptidase superfamily [Helianthus annuus]